MADSPNGSSSAGGGSGIRAFAIAAGQNSGGDHPHDATGAFIPGAQHFGKAYACHWWTFDNLGANNVVRKRFFDAIDQHCPGGTNLFAYFGHGIPKGMASAHCYEEHLDQFLEVLRPKISFPFAAVLYACSAGKENSYTGKLREKLGGDVRVFGHTTAGHAFMNPDVSKEDSGSSPSYSKIHPYGTDLRAAWAEGLKYSDLWLRFPLLSDDQISAELYARRLMGKWEVRTDEDGVYTYQFDWAHGDWSLTPGTDPRPSLDALPSGKLVATDSKNPKGSSYDATWYFTSTSLQINWTTGTIETWPLPLKAVAQMGTAQRQSGDTYLTKAKRISRPQKLGHLQG